VLLLGAGGCEAPWPLGAAWNVVLVWPGAASNLKLLHIAAAAAAASPAGPCVVSNSEKSTPILPDRLHGMMQRHKPVKGQQTHTCASSCCHSSRGWLQPTTPVKLYRDMAGAEQQTTCLPNACSSRLGKPPIPLPIPSQVACARPPALDARIKVVLPADVGGHVRVPRLQREAGAEERQEQMGWG